jgi:hypothetical protein
MAKKKSTGKKHKFKYAAPTGPAAVSAAPVTAVSAPAASTKPAGTTAASPVDDYGYVGRDLMRIGALALGLIVLEVGLWLLFGHTSLGSSVYNLVRV